MVRSTLWAHPFSISQRDVGIRMLTHVTFLCRGIPAINFDYSFTTFECHPFQDIHELPKAQVGHFPSPHRLQAIEVQVLKTQYIVFVAQAVCQLEMMLVALIGNVCAVFCQRPLCPLVTR